MAEAAADPVGGELMASDVQITFDGADPAALAAFWAAALGYHVQGPPEGFESLEQALEAMGVPPEHRNDASAVVDPAGSGPRLFFQREPEAEAERLVSRRHPAPTPRTRSATRRRSPRDGRPQGNEFCLD